MKVPRLYIDTPSPTIEQQIPLPADAAKYLTRVLRRTAGDVVNLFNGDGYNYAATIVSSGKEVIVKVTNSTLNDTESPLSITLVQSLAKGTKLDLVIQKATELGVKRVVPVSADRSIMQIDTRRQQKKMDHWRGIAISASTQCGRSTIPEITNPEPLERWLSKPEKNTMLLHPKSTQSVSTVPLPDQQCTILIGPEGGFTDTELQTATDSDIKIVSCGPRIMRTETAGFAAVAILQSRFGDL